MYKTFIKNTGGIFFVSRRPILNEFANDLAKSIDEESINIKSRVWVFCGAHKKFYWNWLRHGKKILIQTEQFYDDNQKPMWGKNYIKNKILINNIIKSDLFIDLNECNIKFYKDELKLPRDILSKIIFGPYIFPNKIQKNNFANKTKNELAFFGTLNDRRRDKIKTLPMHVNVLNNAFGNSLKQSISESKAILNIHFEAGVYSEWPRILSAFHNRKILISEELSKSLTPNIHYMHIDSINELEQKKIDFIYNNLENLVINK
jgi:hypothetical protein